VKNQQTSNRSKTTPDDSKWKKKIQKHIKTCFRTLWSRFGWFLCILKKKNFITPHKLMVLTQAWGARLGHVAEPLDIEVYADNYDQICYWRNQVNNSIPFQTRSTYLVTGWS